MRLTVLFLATILAIAVCEEKRVELTPTLMNQPDSADAADSPHDDEGNGNTYIIIEEPSYYPSYTPHFQAPSWNSYPAVQWQAPQYEYIIPQTYNYAPPAQTYTAPAPAQTYTAPTQTYTQPQTQTYTPPAQTQTYTAPAPAQTYTAPAATQTYTAPAQTWTPVDTDGDGIADAWGTDWSGSNNNQYDNWNPNYDANQQWNNYGDAVVENPYVAIDDGRGAREWDETETSILPTRPDWNSQPAASNTQWAPSAPAQARPAQTYQAPAQQAPARPATTTQAPAQTATPSAGQKTYDNKEEAYAAYEKQKAELEKKNQQHNADGSKRF